MVSKQAFCSSEYWHVSGLALGFFKHGKILDRSILATYMNRQNVFKFDMGVPCVFFSVPEYAT